VHNWRGGGDRCCGADAVTCALYDETSAVSDELKRRGDFYRQFCERKKKGQCARPFAPHLIDCADCRLDQQWPLRRCVVFAADGSAGRVQIFDKHLVELAAFICTPDENISLAIEYVTHPVHIDRGASETQQSKTLKRKRPSKDKNDKMLTFKRFFRCPAAVTVGTLKKLLRYKLELTGSFEVSSLDLIVFHD
jgi:hypothetical protein